MPGVFGHATRRHLSFAIPRRAVQTVRPTQATKGNEMSDHSTTASGAAAAPAGSGTAVAVLGGGCFWCLEAVFKDLNGVTGVLSGYAGGSTASPSYEQVCSGRTGHAEVVRVSYDPSVLSLADLLRVFFTIHDPTTPNRQGADVGTQYRSVIFTGSDAERDTAQTVMREIAAAGIWDGPN